MARRVQLGLWACLVCASSCAAEATDLGDVPAPADPGEPCYVLRAHDRAVAGDDTPFMVDSGDNEACFFFDVPWPAGSKAVSFRSLHGPLMHHWLLSATLQPAADGEILRNAPHCVIAPDKTLAVFGRGPQAQLAMPEGYGLALPDADSGRGLLLGVHYFNPGPPAHDETAVEVCVASTPPARTAGVVPVGPVYFELPAGQATTVRAECTPHAEAPIQILRSLPHMHALGVAFEASIARADGSVEPLLEITWDVDDQRAYDTPAVLWPGDRLLTTCHFQNDGDAVVISGSRANLEMCTNFVTASPHEALAAEKEVTGGEVCIR